MPPRPSVLDLPDDFFATFFFAGLRAAIIDTAARLWPTWDRAAVCGAKAEALRKAKGQLMARTGEVSRACMEGRKRG